MDGVLEWARRERDWHIKRIDALQRGIIRIRDEAGKDLNQEEIVDSHQRLDKAIEVIQRHEAHAASTKK